MGLFGKKVAQNEDGYWETGISAETIAENTLTPATVDKTKLLLTRVGDDIIAFSRTCPHAAADLNKGSLHRGRISCPDHGWKFDIRSGRTLWPEDEQCRLKRYPVSIENGIVWISI
jgi:nitrite reductase/ring-hydroxylating ferredoxin subunit